MRLHLRWLVIVLALLPAPAAQAGESLAGRLLVAAPKLTDFFAESVLLMLRHDAEGGFGVVVNRPADHAALAHLAARLARDLAQKGLLADVPIRVGGPVMPALALMLTDAASAAQAPMIAGSYALGPAKPMLQEMAAGRRPRRAMVVMGYAGWAPGQLEDELARGAWIVVDADEDLVFGGDDAGKWQKALGRRGREL